MKRLTMKDENGYYLKDKSATITWNSLIGENRYRGEAVDRLVAIEDILCDGTDDYDLDRLAVMCNQRMSMRDEVSQRFSLTAKIPLDRLRELAEADREGRCVVLPCKVGDVVYEIRYTAENTRPGKHAKKKFDHSVSGCTWRMRACPDMCYVSEKKCTKSDFSFMGRTVFLTRAEAEEALKAREQE